MSENTKVTKEETLAALKNPGEIYVVMSAATKLPFVVCDEETYDDEILLYYRLEDAKDYAEELRKKKYPVAIAKLTDKQLLVFYTGLYTLGVNCLAVNRGTDTQISVQLDELVVRKKPEEMKEKKIIENPSFHLTAIYFMQEIRRPGEKIDDDLKDLQEEMIADYKKGIFIIAVQEDNQLPILKQKDGSVYQPIFTDMLEVQRFMRGKKFKTAAVPASKIPDVMIKDAKGVVINPLGVNVQLQISRKPGMGIQPENPQAEK